MVWLRLFKESSLDAGMKYRKCIPKFLLKEGQVRVRPFNLKDRLRIRWVFNMCKLQFYFRKQDIISNPLSPYHKLPKGILKKEKKSLARICKLREGISQALDKTEKHRQDAFNRKKLTGLDKQMADAQIFLAGKNVATVTEQLTTSEILNKFMASENRRDKKRMESAHTKGVRSSHDLGRFQREKLKHFADLGYMKLGKEVVSKKNKKAQEEMNMSMKEYRQMKKENV
jgi:hypothetical protein